MSDGKTLLVLLGPTGVGKTELCIELAEHFGTCILNADSRQLFRKLEIGTAAPSPEQLRRAKHFFVGILDINDYYSAAKYEQDVLELLPQLFKAHDIVLLSGGSMLYTDAVCNGIDDIPTVDEDTREALRKHYEKEGLDTLVQELKLLDPEYYAQVDLRNTRRIIHALEICYMTGRPYTSFRTSKKAIRPFNIIKIGLQRERSELFERINQRVDQMMENGLLDEAKNLFPYRHLNSLNTVGYKEMFQYLDGTWPMEQAIEKIKRNTRVYAKKQMTWYKHDKDINWFHPSQKEEIILFIKKKVKLQ